MGTKVHQCSGTFGRRMIWILYLAITLIVLLLIGNALTYWLQFPILFRPAKLPQDFEFEFDHHFEEVVIESPEEGKIHGLYFHEENKRSEKGIVLYFHGNLGNLTRWGKYYDRQFADTGLDVFFMDYRHYGKSKGAIAESLFYDDALNVYRHFDGLYPAEHITIYGRSIGSGLASFLASKVLAKQILLETPFSSIQDMFYAYYPFLPPVFLFRFNFPNAEHLEKCELPLHIIVSGKDRVTPPKSSARLQSILKDGDSYTVVNEAKHNNLKEFEEFDTWMSDRF
jgi:uncharacterized protein